MRQGRVKHAATAAASASLSLAQLVMVPHGRTPSNEKLLFQGHREGPEGQLLPQSLRDAATGAAAFLASDLGSELKRAPSRFVFLRSPLQRAAQTADAYLRAIGEAGLPVPDVEVDSGLLEIDHSAWHGWSAEEMHGDEGAAARAYRHGSFFAKPIGGESNLELLARCDAWLAERSSRHAGKVVVCFGHGTFQNAAEVLLRTLGATEPKRVFSRRPGESHLRRGFAHRVYPPLA